MFLAKATEPLFWPTEVSSTKRAGRNRLERWGRDFECWRSISAGTANREVQATLIRSVRRYTKMSLLPSGICEKRARRPWRWWEPAWEERLLAMRRSPRHRARSTAWFYSARAPGGQAEITQFAHRGTRRRERGWPASTRDSRAIQKSA